MVAGLPDGCRDLPENEPSSDAPVGCVGDSHAKGCIQMDDDSLKADKLRGAKAIGDFIKRARGRPRRVRGASSPSEAAAIAAQSVE